MLTCLDLFSGIGGFALGFHRAGIRTTAFCEIHEPSRRVLRKNFPGIPIFVDVNGLSLKLLRLHGIEEPDVVCGGFPCQDISLAGYHVGLDGSRSSLWWQYHRLLAELAPRWVVIENVSILRTRGLDRVLRSLGQIGYDAEWHCIPASAFGMCHTRDRVWIVAYPNGTRRQGLLLSVLLADPDDTSRPRWGGAKHLQELYASPYLPGDSWPAPLIRRVDDGLSGRVDRLRGLGNSIVPQIAEYIGKAIVREEEL